MRRDAVFGDVVHFAGADLQFDALLAGADHGRVDRAIVVLLRRRDVILEPARHDRPGRVHDAERLIAIRRPSSRSRGTRRYRTTARSRPTCAPSCARSNRRASAGPSTLAAMPRSASFLVSCCSISVDQIAVALGERRQPLGRRRDRRPDRARGTTDPRAPRAFPACPCGRQAAHRFRSSPRRCGGAPPAT